MQLCKAILIITYVMGMSVSLLLTKPAVAQQDENAVKAAFIYNFINFVEWPKKIHSKNSSTILCVVGDDAPVVGYLAELSKKAKVTLTSKGRDASLTNCHMVYIGKMGKADIDYMIGKTKNMPILTVSAVKDFAKKGGHIGFVIEEGQVKLESNLKSLEGAGLRVDSELLELMTIYQ